ncbi:MAG: hypothetical protein HYU58_00160 [Proteobacteria bacterium]|nr:hypothetical protein [Pseudomonadota bacterium]
MIGKGMVALGTVNKAWAAAIAAPLAEWLVGLLADTLWAKWQIATPDSAEMAIVSLIVGLVVYHMPNLPAEPADDGAEQAGA